MHLLFKVFQLFSEFFSKHCLAKFDFSVIANSLFLLAAFFKIDALEFLPTIVVARYMGQINLKPL